MKSKFKTAAAILALSLGLVACGKKDDSSNKESNNASNSSKAEVSATMVTDQGGINDKSFNQSSYEGLKAYQDEGKIKFDYIESHKDSDYQPNLESALDSKSDIIFTVGYALFDATSKAAEENPEQNYAIIDNENSKNQKNLLGITFADHENSFLVGYIAGMKTESNNVGFVGGMESAVIDRFQYGFMAGVKQAAREKGKDIEVQVQYANSYSDQAKGKNIANQMYQNGADVIFQAAGGTGIGVFEAAKENNKYIIGVDRDQKEEAPDNILASTIKGVGKAVQLTIDDYKEGKFKGGETVSYSLKDGDALGIAYGDNDLVSKEVKDKVEDLRNQIVDGKIKVPQNEEEFTSMGYDK
ncbi:BMP family ABC transporter substrate-binding protein [Anaerococcus sp. AGMB00486]|uniref:BMP family ABC transporter substrate-binding protein n=1 Tax=Anaerococcus faecalis TaxID=2742993 RepID=A0ABX2NBI7_9FIRM|nr:MULTISPECIES: BMP family ABC transporter substrate-binding protein [Anaerococcus]MDY3006663.1 BMP family ABC transporter substrate-binding protein [Anaerococcus porci]NVF12066.1 BMP family ABC transporter substrate-binding protein [Anaerococcus faecalis]